MTAALDQQCGLAARFDRMEVGERRVAARERHEVTLGETRASSRIAAVVS